MFDNACFRGVIGVVWGSPSGGCLYHVSLEENDGATIFLDLFKRYANH